MRGHDTGTCPGDMLQAISHLLFTDRGHVGVHTMCLCCCYMCPSYASLLHVTYVWKHTILSLHHVSGTSPCWPLVCTNLYTIPGSNRSNAQALLLVRARCAWGYGIDSAPFVRRCGIDANEKSNCFLHAMRPNHQPSRSLFSRHTAFYLTAPDEEADVAEISTFRGYCDFNFKFSVSSINFAMSVIAISLRVKLDFDFWIRDY